MARTLRLFAPRRRTVGPLILIVLVIVVVLPVVLSLTWAISHTAMESVSANEVCTACHTMRPMVEAYEQDVHGGNSAHGVSARCVDCHAPHDSAFNFVWIMARDRLREVWVEIARDPETIDWESKRENRERFVYDSGCMSCHRNIEDTSRASATASVAHEQFFRGEGAKSCVACHEHVGHHNLGAFLRDG